MQDSGHTSEWTGQRVERVRSNGKRIFTLAFKTWLTEQSLKPGVSVAGLAMRNGVNANLLRRWMSLARPSVDKPAPVLLPVQVVHTPEVTQSMSSPALLLPIEIEVAGAVVRVRDARQLRMVLDALRS